MYLFIYSVKELLIKLGLSTIESALYEALVTKGSLSVSALAEASGLYRPQVYKYLPGLIDKGLVTETRHGSRVVYMAESPRHLEKLIDNLKSEVCGQMPQLLKLYSNTESRPTVSYFEGEKGIRHIYKDLVATCKKGDIFYRYESPRNYHAVRKYLPQEYYDRFRDSAEVERLIITNEVTKQQKKERLGRIIKVVPPKYDLFDYDISQLIYGDKVAFIDFRSETASLIESPLFAQFQRKIFKLLFDKL